MYDNFPCRHVKTCERPQAWDVSGALTRSHHVSRISQVTQRFSAERSRESAPK
jgi:hypothetical protein